MTLRPAAEILLIAVEEIGRALSEAAEADRDRTTACDPWTVRDVLAHCSGSMLRAVENRGHRFTPEDNEIDVVERRSWPFDQVRDELQMTAPASAARIDAGGGSLDGLGLGVWVHSGDIREALGIADPYAAPGFELGIRLLEERSRRKDFSLDVHLGDRSITFGAGPSVGDLTTDIETFVRVMGGRSPDPAHFRLTGAEPPDLVLFG
jgi:uncharacterized protein (TIGR03083 family)